VHHVTSASKVTTIWHFAYKLDNYLFLFLLLLLSLGARQICVHLTDLKLSCLLAKKYKCDKLKTAAVEKLPTSIGFGLWNVGMTTSAESCRSGISSWILTDDTRDWTSAPNSFDDSFLRVWRLLDKVCHRDSKTVWFKTYHKHKKHSIQ